jgi:hypothetical protein
MFCLLQSALSSFTRRNRGVKLRRHPPSLPLRNSFHGGRGPCAPGRIDREDRNEGLAECLGAVAALARIPLIDDHLHRHLASPQAGGALLLVGSCRQSSVTAFAVDRRRRCNTTPRWWCLFRNLPYSNFQIADLVELNDLETRIGNRRRYHPPGTGVWPARFPPRHREILGPHSPCCRAP